MSEEYQKPAYASYNGLSRTANILGVPYMAGMGTASVTMLASLLCAMTFGGGAWLYPLIVGITLLLFMKNLCENDDAGLQMFLLELKWRWIKATQGGGKEFGGTLTIHPISYGRVNYEQAKKYFKRPASWK
jgi:type IV secretory pathway VirB3-like protein